MDSDYFNQTNNNNSGGLLRFRSAPSSFLENYVNGVEKITPKRFCSRVSIGDEDMSVKSKTVANKHIATVNSQLPPQYPRRNGGVLDTTLGTNISTVANISSIGTVKVCRPGLFSENGYAETRGIGSYKLAEDCGNEDITSPNSLKNNHTNFSSLGQLSRFREVGNESENGLMPFSSWNDSSIFDESFTSGLIKRELDIEHNLFTDQHGELENRTNMLSRHLSLPKTAAEMATMEKFLQLQDSVPCKIRAKRGCATHPRSIAERVRRTRISERMRKLQELVPNMDKQTNTSDMLDLAVDYIKNLQKQYMALRESRANCKCMPSPTSQKTVINQMN